MLPRVNMIRTDQTDYLLFSTDDLISRYIYVQGQWESMNLAIAKLVCDGVDKPLVIDVGANLGAFAVPVAQQLSVKGGLVYAFEPQRIIFYQLCANIFLNRLDCCVAQNFAIGDVEGILELRDADYSSMLNTGAYSLVKDFQKQSQQMPEKNDGISYQVPVKTLDSLKFPRPVSLIKIDVEGMEINVLKGAVSLLKSSGFPPIMFEAWSDEWYQEKRQELLSFLESIGYEYFFFNETDAIAQHKQSPRLIKLIQDQTTNSLSYYFVKQSIG